MDIETIDSGREDEEIDIELSNDEAEEQQASVGNDSKQPKQTVQQLLARQAKFLDMCQETKTVSFLTAVCQLSHAYSDLAASVWKELFPRIWKVTFPLYTH